MGNCSRCLHFNGALFKDEQYAKDTCGVTGGILRNIIENCSGFVDRGNKPWSPWIKEKFEMVDGIEYKTITRTTDGEKIRLKAVGINDEWVEVDENNQSVNLIELEDGVTKEQRLQIRADILAWAENGFKKKSKKKEIVKDPRVEELI